MCLRPPCRRYSKVHSGSSLRKRATLQAPTGLAPKCSVISRKQMSSPWYCPSPKVEFNRTYYFNKSYAQHKYPRYTVVRSDLAEAGSSGVACPLSGYEVFSRVRGVCFYVVTAVVAIFLFQWMLVAHPFVLLLDRYRRKAHHFIAKLWSTWSVATFYKIQIEGLENLPPPDTPAVYVSNHQSFLDIYTLLTLGRSFKFISKTDIFLFPIIGWAMYMLGSIPLKRMDSRSQLETLKRCMDLIKKGASVFFFPEGTRSKDGKLGAFKKGAFSIAAKTKVPVVPITLIGTGKIMPAGNEITVNPGNVKIIIHKPIEGSDAEALSNEARATISRALDV
ncbi:1-acyl-sn-glycerol-3-phosphate acyltransferase LPAT1, chloroplastic isoform X2 [Punica granatum]|uniref:1-acyl-sn-glycerol-3-phosphate acyltransferase n=1 Tax=Punica granatum TaxID=22663 RepID=A0A6P8D520_PUNGR|nr:1-acyl-sn-glycerol-3-phosphate acyltransferase LPAT1, chloroplastic isoform X2 [Punica granatum]